MNRSVFLLTALVFISLAFSQTLIIINVSGRQDKNITFEERDNNSLFLRVLDDSSHAVEGITADILNLQKEGRDAKIIDCTPLTRTEEVSQKIILVLDNSSSMSHALNELHASIDAFVNNLGGASEVAIVLFDENKERLAANNVRAKGELVNLRINAFTNDHQKLLHQSRLQITKSRLTKATYLNDAVYVALQMQMQQAPGFQKSIVILSDGEDTGSKLPLKEAIDAASNTEIKIFCIDFSGGRRYHAALNKIAAASAGQLFKADNPQDLVQVFDSISREVTTIYLVKYKMPSPPTGDVAFIGDSLFIKNRFVIDESPLLNYIFFDSNSAAINEKYHLLTNEDQVDEFDETQIDNPLDKYYHLLNIVGSRMRAHSEADITLIGCNCGMGAEKNNVDLSRSRVEEVGDYLISTWHIAQDRIHVEAINLPEKPSSMRTVAGMAENRRVEITSNDDFILRPVRSVIVEHEYTPSMGGFKIKVEAKDGLDYWTLHADSGDETLYESQQTNPPGSTYFWNWIGGNGKKISGIPFIDYKIDIHDQDGKVFDSAKKRIYVRENSSNSMAASEQDGKIIEKYSLILFDFNSSTFGVENRAMLDKVTTSAAAHDSACISVLGFCDDIGDEDYNLRLSQRRARGVYQQLLRTGIAKQSLSMTGYGESNPIFSNGTPEGRFLNRTVQVYVTYPSNAQKQEAGEGTEI